MKRFLVAILVGVFLLGATSVFAGTATFYLAPIDVFGTGGTTSKYVTPTQLSKGDKVDLAQALDNLPGIYTLAKGPAAYDVMLNGLNRDNINVLIDGAKIYGGCPSRMDVPIFHIPMNAIQVMKITYGPFDVTHQGSMGGLVEVKTITPKKGFHSNISVGLNSYQLFTPNIETSYNNGKFYVVGGYSFETAKPYKDANGTRITDYLKGEYKSDRPSRAYNLYSYFGKVGFMPNPDTDIYFSYMKKDAEKVLYPFLGMDAIYDRSNIVNFEANRRNLQGVIDSAKIKFYYTDVYHLMTNEYRNAPMYASVYAATQVYGGQLSAGLKGGFTVGLDGFKRKWNVKKTNIFKAQFMVPDVSIRNFSIFMKKTFRLSRRVSLEAGARVDVSRAAPNTSLQQEDNQQFPMYFALYKKFYGETPDRIRRNTYPSGYLKLKYAIAPGSTLFLGVGHGTRLPDPEERYLCLLKPGKVWLGNPTLDPVKNNEVDLGINARVGGLGVNATAYYKYIKDYITLTKVKTPNMLYILFQNTDAKMYGFNVGLSYDLFKTLLLKSTTSFVRGRQDTDAEKYIRSHNMPDMPPLREIFTVKFHKPTYFVEVQTILSARQKKTNSDVWEKGTPGYGIINLKAGYKYNHIYFEAGVDNLLDKEYYTYTDYYSNPYNTGIKLPQPGRTFYANIAYRF